MHEIEQLLSTQDGVIARRQARAAGLSDADIRRRIRRREWVAVHLGVYVDHTGPLTWRQRAWAAVLLHWPAALDGWSAIRAHEGPGRWRFDERAPIELMVPHDRRLTPTPGIRVRRSRRFAAATQPHLSPPRRHYDDVVIELADRARDELAAIAVLADACGARRTTAARLRDRATTMARLTRRSWIAAVLDDIAEGNCSVLEHAFLVRVERPHGLPRGLRQVPDRDRRGRRLFRDVVYAGRDPHWRQVVELDGRLGHETAAERDRDLERDLEAALDGADTIRLGYGQVVGRPCRTAAMVGRLLRLRGWQGTATTCPHCYDT
ncbi:hypothetical protein KVF89_01675 [Nocardioides carbamazepini]|uniref:hypothetical protein n=1 Tax=Nocardioides carbamazepini TaxID=2854259 RepID=UPI002149A269|nr:hypothetical protein [Nocardioides carbamazepini]MCR1781232.1 hypothetical protein [Nocardioides carbamazepini]